MSSIRARNRGSFNDIQQFYFERATHMVAICVCTMTVALHEEFGFGNERCARLLERYKKINRHMNDYQDDVKSEAELRGAMAQIGLQEFADQILSMHEIEHYRQEIKNMNKVSVKEAAEAKRQLEMMQEIMKQQQNRKMSLT